MIRKITKREAECDFCHVKQVFETDTDEPRPDGWGSIKVGYPGFYQYQYLDACPKCLKKEGKKK
jgi:hypothetical protein